MIFGSINSGWGVAGIVLSIVAVLLGGMGVGGLLKVILDHKRGVRKQTDDMATAVVAAVTIRLATVERHSILCEANLAAMRHSKNNLSAAFDAFLLLIKTSPDRADEFVGHIEKMRREHARAEALERAEILKAALAATSDDPAAIIGDEALRTSLMTDD